MTENEPPIPQNSDKLAHRETAIEPDLEIVDTHHHLWDAPAHWMATYYPIEHLIKDVGGGHNVTHSIYLECSSHYHTDGPEELAPVGETEWVASIDSPEGLLAGIVGFADVRLGKDVNRVLDAHVEAAGKRFKGIRYSSAFDDHPDVVNTARDAPPGTLLREDFQEGVRALGSRGLLFESWAYFHQLNEIKTLAQAAPNTRIVLDHLGGPAGTGPYAGKRDEMRKDWRRNLADLAQEENVVAKIGGIGFPPYLEPDVTPKLKTSADIAEYWMPEVRFCIETFGPDRCMFESNFPVDSHLCDYVTLWNAFKLMTNDLSADERSALFSGTAKRVYSLN